MEDNGWLREHADERLQGLFSEDGALVHRTVSDVIDEARLDPNLEEIVVDTFSESIAEGNDDTQASVWLAIILGELQSADAIEPLLDALRSDDESLLAGAVRALRRIGRPAFEALLGMIEEAEIDCDLYIAVLAALEGVAMYDEAEIRDRLETHLRWRVANPQKGRDGIRAVEAAALALARLGVSDARANIQRTLINACGGRNAFLTEALDIMDEHPRGLPCASSSTWDAEFRWNLTNELPGGDIASLLEDEDVRAAGGDMRGDGEGGDPSLERSPHSR
ncbi:MAG: HEAT repeat domain-containing protein [Planctomycetes bacterium]|nr:HEAT repeat domain-containing protein [Planctomycetota bacterium]